MRNLLKKISLVFFIPVSILGQAVWSQTAMDSLQAELKKSSGTNRVDILNQISLQYHLEHPDSSFNYAKKAKALAIELDYKTGQALAAKNKGNYYVRTSNYKKAIIEYDLAIALYKEEKSREGQTLI